MKCRGCGTCCVAPDIKTIGKGIGERCPFLDPEERCSRYESRPEVCRGYRPDEICRLVAAPSLEERVEKYLALFQLN